MDEKNNKKGTFWEEFFNNNRNMYITIGVVIAILFLVYTMIPDPVQTEGLATMEYAEFLEKLEAGEVDQIRYSRSNEFMTVTFFNDETRQMPIEEREQYEYPPEDTVAVKYPAYDEFRSDMLKHGADPTMLTASTTFMDIVSTLVGVAMMGGMVFLLIILIKSGPAAAMLQKEKDIIKTSDVKFADVIGQDEVIEDLKFIVELMKDPSLGEDIGAKVPKGLLLAGPPGTGKTMLAKAIAGEAGVPFLQMSGSNFIEMYVGVGAKRVRDLFKLARKHAPCVVFIDEIDAVGAARSKSQTSEHEQTVNALLEQMDGFTSRNGIFLIAATNRADQLDEALVRPGRFDRQVTVNPPMDWKVRKQMFEHYLGKLTLDENVDIENLSRQTPGFTGADIAAICNEAGMIAVMAHKPCVDTACLEEAIDKKVFMGNRSKREQFEHDRNIVAYHEAGHAVMTWLLKEPISRASIQATTSGVGGAVFGGDRESQFMTVTDFRNRVMIAYAGRASEQIKFHDVTTGASNDITQATNLLVQYVERLGFDKNTGLLDISVLSKDHLVNTQSTIQALTRLSNELYEKCVDTLKANYAYVDILAECLLMEESLPGPRIERLLEKTRERVQANGGQMGSSAMHRLIKMLQESDGKKG